MSIPDLTPGMYRQCRKEREALYEANAELRERIAELERREALLTAFFVTYRKHKVNAKVTIRDVETAEYAVIKAGFPW